MKEFTDMLNAVRSIAPDAVHFAYRGDGSPVATLTTLDEVRRYCARVGRFSVVVPCQVDPSVDDGSYEVVRKLMGIIRPMANMPAATMRRDFAWFWLAWMDITWAVLVVGGMFYLDEIEEVAAGFDMWLFRGMPAFPDGAGRRVTFPVIDSTLGYSGTLEPRYHADYGEAPFDRPRRQAPPAGN